MWLKKNVWLILVSSHWRTSCTRAGACPPARHGRPCAQPRTRQDGAKLSVPRSLPPCSWVPVLPAHAWLQGPRTLLSFPQAVSEDTRHASLLTRSNCHRTGEDSLFRNSLETKPSTFRKKVKNYFLSLTKTLFYLEPQCFFIATASISSSARFSLRFISMWLRKANI